MVWLGFTFVQGVVWWSLYDPKGPLLRPILRWVNENPTCQANVCAHVHPELRAYGCGELGSDTRRLVGIFGTSYVAVPHDEAGRPV